MSNKKNILFFLKNPIPFTSFDQSNKTFFQTKLHKVERATKGYYQINSKRNCNAIL